MKLRKLFVLGAVIAAVGLMVPSCEVYDDGEAFVRFTWEAAEQQHIDFIAASYTDVDAWYYDVYYVECYAPNGGTPENCSDVPVTRGSRDLPNNIYSRTLGSTVNKGKYFPIKAGTYTAVAAVEDPNPLFDDASIVANYTITIDKATTSSDGNDRYFEIAFDVGTYLAGEDDLGWFGETYDNPNDGPRLSKSILVKTIAPQVFKMPGGTMEVTYYVIRRPKR